MKKFNKILKFSATPSPIGVRRTTDVPLAPWSI